MHVLIEAAKPKTTSGIVPHLTLGVILAIATVFIALILAFVARAKSKDAKTLEPTVGLPFMIINDVLIGVLCLIGGNFKTISHLVHTVTGGKVGTP